MKDPKLKVRPVTLRVTGCLIRGHIVNARPPANTAIFTATEFPKDILNRVDQTKFKAYIVPNKTYKLFAIWSKNEATDPLDIIFNAQGVTSFRRKKL